MGRRIVLSTRAIAASPEALWQTVGDFASDWHPAIASCTREIGPDGGEGRRFTGPNGGEYRERLTYRSASDRMFRYTLTHGIEGVMAYHAQVSVHPDAAGSRLSWRACIEAPEDRLDAIAEGTFEVFQAGFSWLETAALPATAPAPDTPPPAQSTPITRRTCDAGTALSWLCAGPEGGDTLVLLLHGIGGNAQNWAPQLGALGAAYRVAALDLRGYGDSALGPAQTTVEDHCADILRVMRAEGADRVVLGGLSMGAWIATGFAMRHPQALAGLILAGGCTGMSEASAEARAGFLNARAEPLDAGKTPADFAASIVDIIAGPQADAAMRETLRASMAAIPAKTYRDALTCFCNPPERFDFAGLHCPVLLMTGEHDTLAPPDEIRDVAERIHGAMTVPDIRFEVIAGSGHLCNLERAGAVTAAVSCLLERVIR